MIKKGDKVQMICSPSCFGEVVGVKTDVGKHGFVQTFQVMWEDGPISWVSEEAIRLDRIEKNTGRVT